MCEKHGKICDNVGTEPKYSMLALIWFQTNFEKLLMSYHYILPRLEKKIGMHTGQAVNKAQNKKSLVTIEKC